MNKWREWPWDALYFLSDMYMEHFEERVLETAQNPSRLWNTYVDDTFVVQQLEHKGNFLKHINSINQPIKFPVEDINT